MPVKELHGFEDFTNMSFTRIAGETKVIKIEDNVETPAAVVYDSLVDADATVVQSIEINTGARTTLEVYASASDAIDFTMSVSIDGTNWITYNTWNAVTEVKEGYVNSWPYVKLESSASTTAGATVTMYLVAK